MESVINFLEKNDETWGIYHSQNHNPHKPNEKIQLELLNLKPYEINQYLKNKIKEAISGNNLNQSDFSRIKDHLALKYYSSKENEHTNAFHFIKLIEYTINQVDGYTNSEASWRLTRDYLEIYLSRANHTPDESYFKYDQNREVAKSILFLKKKGYHTSIILGQPTLDKEHESKLLHSINHKFEKLGYDALLLTLRKISPTYRPNLSRYILRQAQNFIEDPYKIDIPWGYLFNLSLAHLHPGKKNKFYKKSYDECTELLKHFFHLRKIQSPNILCDSFHRYDTILSAVQNIILYDQHFSIDQISGKHITQIIEGIFTSKALSHLKHKPNLDLYLDILTFSSKRSAPDKPLFFETVDIYHVLKRKYYPKEIIEALDLLSHKRGETNASYLTPDKINKRNHYKKPFINIGDIYIYANDNFCNFGFYNTISEIFKKNGADSNALGNATEEFAYNLLSKSGISATTNKKYKIQNEIKKELGIKSDERECDYIVETSDTIIFIELKSKTLTTEARSGNLLRSTLDLTQSFFRGIAQAGCHEYILKRNGEIAFKDGTKIELRGRNIERVALTVFGYFGLQDTQFTQQLMHNLAYAQIESDNPKADQNINDTLTEIKNQLEALERLGNRSQFERYLNCRFFSIPQFMQILENSSNNEEFKTELNRTRNISTGQKDWFFEYNYIRNLMRNTEHK